MECAFTSDSGLKFVAPELVTYTAISGSVANDYMSPTVDVYNFALLVIWVCCSELTSCPL